MVSKVFSVVGAIISSYSLCVMSATIDTSPSMVIGFDCEKMPEICINICWANNCANPDFPLLLSYDKPSDQVKKDRRKSAGCVLGNNKCNKKNKSNPLHRGAPYISCDEYPYASTQESDKGDQVSRCVEIGEQRYQGGKLRKLPAPVPGGGPVVFKTNLSYLRGKVPKYCEPNPDCTNDGYQIQDKKITKRDIQSSGRPRGPRPRTYRTKSGIEILSVEDYGIGQTYKRELLKDEKELEGFSYYMFEGEMFVDDEIVEMIEHGPTGNSMIDDGMSGNSTMRNSTMSNSTMSNSTIGDSMMFSSTVSDPMKSSSTFSTSTASGASTIGGYN